MLGSSNSIACANIMLNSAVASVLKEFADVLEKDNSHENIIKLINKEVSAHKRILFNGNGYGDEWVAEAEKRGLLNLKTTPDCLPYVLKDKNVKMLTEIGTFTKTEIYSRYNIHFENYCECMLLEARTMVEMSNEGYLPAMSKISADMAENILKKKQALNSIPCDYELKIVKELSELLDDSKVLTDKLIKLMGEARIDDVAKKAVFIKDNIIPVMAELRSKVDEAERLSPESAWPFPSYGKIMFSVD